MDKFDNVKHTKKEARSGKIRQIETHKRSLRSRQLFDKLKHTKEARSGQI